jgi:hypothetical protein
MISIIPATPSKNGFWKILFQQTDIFGLLGVQSISDEPQVQASEDTLINVYILEWCLCIIILKSIQVSNLEDSLHHSGTFWVKFIPAHPLFQSSEDLWGSFSSDWTPLGQFWLQFISDDLQPHNCNPLRIPSNSCHEFGSFEAFLNTFHICWFPSLLVKASGNHQLAFPHSDALVNLSLLVHVWCSPSSEVQPSKYCAKKKLFSSFWPSCTNLKYSPYLTTAKPPSSTQ